MYSLLKESKKYVLHKMRYKKTKNCFFSKTRVKLALIYKSKKTIYKIKNITYSKKSILFTCSNSIIYQITHRKLFI